MKIQALGYVGFKSPHSEQWRQFGPEILAMMLQPDAQDGAVRLRMDERHHRLAIHPGEQDEFLYVGWELATRRAFEDALAELDAKGVAYHHSSREERDHRCVMGMAWLEDPSGFRHELFWGQLFEQAPFLPPRPHGGYVGNELGGIGHIVFAAPELTRAHEEFATQVLGFEIITYLVVAGPDGEPLPVEVYRCNERSHCLVWSPFGGLKGVSHIYMETKLLDDLGRTYDLVKQHEIPIALDLGKFTTDTDIFFYLRTPSGFDIQYAWDTGIGRNLEAETAQTYDARHGSTVAWGLKPLAPMVNSTMRPADKTSAE